MVNGQRDRVWRQVQGGYLLRLHHDGTEADARENEHLQQTQPERRVSSSLAIGAEAEFVARLCTCMVKMPQLLHK